MGATKIRRRGNTGRRPLLSVLGNGEDLNSKQVEGHELGLCLAVRVQRACAMNSNQTSLRDLTSVEGVGLAETLHENVLDGG